MPRMRRAVYLHPCDREKFPAGRVLSRSSPSGKPIGGTSTWHGSCPLKNRVRNHPPSAHSYDGSCNSAAILARTRHRRVATRHLGGQAVVATTESGNGSRALLLATISFTLSFAAWGLIGGLASVFAELYRLTASQTALLVSIPVLLGSLARLPMGMLDRSLRRPRHLRGADGLVGGRGVADSADIQLRSAGRGRVLSWSRRLVIFDRRRLCVALDASRAAGNGSRSLRAWYARTIARRVWWPNGRCGLRLALRVSGRRGGPPGVDRCLCTVGAEPSTSRQPDGCRRDGRPPQEGANRLDPRRVLFSDVRRLRRVLDSICRRCCARSSISFPPTPGFAPPALSSSRRACGPWAAGWRTASAVPRCCRGCLAAWRAARGC